MTLYTSLEDVLKEVCRLEAAGEPVCTITSDGVLTCDATMPRTQHDPDEATTSNDETTYTVPLFGDMLVGVTIMGQFTTADMFQYDFMGSHKVVFDSIDHSQSGTMAPFGGTGFPLLQLGKSVHILVRGKAADTVVKVTYGFLPNKSRAMVARYRHPNGNGVKLRHNNGTVYQVAGVDDFGHSPNYLCPV